MKIMLSLVLLVSLPLIALAQPDSTPDVMGIYFDHNGWEAETGAPASTPFFAYVVLLNPTQNTIEGYEFGYDHWVAPENESLVFRLAAVLPGGNIYINPPITYPLHGSFLVGLPTPMPADQAVVLLTWQYMLMGSFSMHMYLAPAESPTVPGGLPGYWGPGGVKSTGYAETCFGVGARVNEYCPLSVDAHTWGTLKGLYR